MENEENKTCAKDKKNKTINFSIAFNQDGESFQNIMEKVLINKINKEL